MIEKSAAKRHWTACAKPSPPGGWLPWRPVPRGQRGPGQRILFGTGQTADCAVDFAGNPVDVRSAGWERWPGIFTKTVSRRSSDALSELRFLTRLDASAGKVSLRMDVGRPDWISVSRRVLQPAAPSF